MLYYILPYFFLFSVTLIIYFLKLPLYKKKTIFAFALFPASIIAILRGTIGTDTISYLTYYKELITGKDFPLMEPGFEWLSKSIIFVIPNEQFAVALISVLTTFVLLYSFSSSKETMILFSLVLFPIFYVDMTMNAIRYGLSFSIMSVAIKFLYRRNLLASYLLGILAISIQYSSVLIFLPFALFKIKFRYIFFILLCLMVILPFLPLTFEYIYSKQDLYKDAYSPNTFSGVFPLLLFIGLFLSFVKFSTVNKSWNILIFLLLFEIIFFLISRITYAGLRLQMVMVFSLIILIKEEYVLIKNKSYFLIAIILISFFGFGLTAKNVISEPVDIRSPYLPYRFFWEEKFDV